MQEGNRGYPRVRAGSNIYVEELQDGYRISSVAPMLERQNFFMVRHTVGGSLTQPTRIMHIINGSLPPDEAMDFPAGYVSIERLHWIPEEKGGPAIGSRQLRFEVPAGQVSALSDCRLVMLRVSAHNDNGVGVAEFKDGNGRKVTFRTSYVCQPEVPTEEEGVLYIPLAELEWPKGGEGFLIRQLSYGEPHGVIQGFYGWNTLDPEGSDSESDSFSGSWSDSDSWSESSDSSDVSDSHSGPFSSSTISGSDSDSSWPSDSISESPTWPSDSDSWPSGSDSWPSGSDSGPGGSDSGGGPIDPPIIIKDKWYLVLVCRRVLVFEMFGENYSNIVDCYMCAGSDIHDDPEPEPPTMFNPTVEYEVMIVLEGPFDHWNDLSEDYIEEVYWDHAGESCW